MEQKSSSKQSAESANTKDNSILNFEKNQEIIKVNQVLGTPFAIIQNTDKNTLIGTLGNYAVTETLENTGENFQKISEYLQKPSWELISRYTQAAFKILSITE